MACKSHIFIDVIGAETASSFSHSTSYKIVDDTEVIDNESDNDHDISDTETSTSSSEQSCDRLNMKQMYCKEHRVAITSSLIGRIQSDQLIIDFQWLFYGEKN